MSIAADPYVTGPTLAGLRLGATAGDAARDPLTIPEDTLAPWRPDRKRFATAVAEIGLVWVIPWTWNRHIVGHEWARVGPDTWGDNLTGAWVWDDDNFTTNQFSHPYHGNLYFNAGRSNGYDFWASAGFTVFGAWGWETFGETNPPALNDLISTSLGGIAFGEATHRLATMLRDNTATGPSRTWRELGGLLLDPVGGFNRMTRGELGRVRVNPPDRLPSRFSVTVTGGGQVVSNRVEATDAEVTGQFGASAALNYGNPFVDTLAHPFSTFRALIEIATNNEVAIQRLNYEGAIVGHRKTPGPEGASSFLMLTQRFLYFKNPALEFSAVGLNGKYGRRWVHRDVWTTVLETGPGWVVLGAVPSAILPGGRDYDFGTGGTMMLEGSVRRRGVPFLSVSGSSAYLATVDGTAKGHLLNTATATIHLPVRGRMSAGLRWFAFWRNSFYGDHEDHGQVNEIHAFASWTFGYSGDPAYTLTHPDR